jgi:hypothetical protein
MVGSFDICNITVVEDVWEAPKIRRKQTFWASSSHFAIQSFQKVKSYFYNFYNTIYTKKRQVSATSLSGNGVYKSSTRYFVSQVKRNLEKIIEEGNDQGTSSNRKIIVHAKEGLFSIKQCCKQDITYDKLCSKADTAYSSSQGLSMMWY